MYHKDQWMGADYKMGIASAGNEEYDADERHAGAASIKLGLPNSASKVQ
jgi:hypothetical protein